MELNTPLTEAFKLTHFQKQALSRLNLNTVRDLLFHFPTRYSEIIASRPIGELSKGEDVTLYATIEKLKLGKAYRKKIPMADGVLRDPSGSIKVVWFNQPYIAKMIKEGSSVRVVGKVGERKGELYLANPEIEESSFVGAGGDSSLFGKEDNLFGFPTYPETRGVTSRWFYYALQKILRSGIVDSVEDPLPSELLKKYNLPSLKAALVWIHTPKREVDTTAARKRFSFEEVFYIQLIKWKERKEYESKKSFIIEPKKNDVEEFIGRFPFEATLAQRNAIQTILEDFKSGHPMSRLLEGDVGSGKTAVAASTAYASVVTRPRGQDFGTLQVAYMAPTEILAAQHFESFIQYFKHLPIQIALITGSGCRKFPSKVNPEGSTEISRSQLLKWVKNGEIAILLGTHALIQKSVQFKDLGYIIIDEQHRFGTAQRQKLARKGDVLPHLLSMTATPIPRTLALTIYGDLDLSLLDEMPAGRKPIITEVVTPEKRNLTYEKVRKELERGKQVYVICPRIDEPDPKKELAVLAKSAKEEARRLKAEVFPEFEIGVLHSKMKPKEKDEMMYKFKNHKIDILVATSVVEVGVNVPNATVIIIEGAERFGLSQLHQLRGRVIRSNDQAYCYIFSEGKGEKTLGRLRAITKAKNGFELAELDLELRGAGELYGRRQWGVSDVGMEAMKNLKMVEAARKEAKEYIERDPNLRDHPFIAKKLTEKKEILHFE